MIMIGHPHLRRLAAGTAVLVLSLAGCKQTDTLQSSSPRQQSSWLSKLPFSRSNRKKSKDESLPPVTAEQKADVQMALARSFEKQGQIDQAIKIYSNIVRKDDRRADACHRLAVLHDRKGDCGTSEQFYRAALEREPRNAATHCDLGYSFYLQRRWQEGEASLRQAIAIKPDLTRAHINLGLLLARIGRDDESLMEFSRAGCPEADARANLAFAFMLEERWMESQRQYEFALAIDPQSEAARHGLDALQSLHSRFESRQVTLANGNGNPTETARVPYVASRTGGGRRLPEAKGQEHPPVGSSFPPWWD